MAAGATYTPIATTTVASLTTNINFTSIGSGYTDLRVILNGGLEYAGGGIRLKFNGTGNTNFSFTRITGNGTSASSARSTAYINVLSSASDVNNVCIIDVFSYANTSTYKTALCAGGNASDRVERTVGLWTSTSAITEINLIGTENFKVGTTATLYGIAAA